MSKIKIGPPGKTVEEVWIFTVKNHEGIEGVIATPMEGFGVIPMITADKNSVPLMKKYAQGVADMTGHTVTILKLTSREVMETLKPGPIEHPPQKENINGEHYH